MSALDKSQVQQSQPAPTYSDRQFLHTQTAGVVLPLLQALITSGLLAFSVLMLSWVFGWSGGWKAALAVLGVMPFVAWLYLQRRWLVLTAERVLQRDFNGDGVVESSSSKSEPRIVKVQVSHIKEKGSLQVDLIDLPCSGFQLRELAEGLLNDVPFAEALWTGRGRPFSVAEFRVLRSTMLRRNLLQMRSEKDLRQGFELTEDGKTVMQGAL